MTGGKYLASAHPYQIDMWRWNGRKTGDGSDEVNSHSRKLVFTIGYEGRDVPGMMSVLRGAGVEQLIDVRERPISRKAGFSKTGLCSASSVAGIHYIHLGGLGSPSEIRHNLRENGDFACFVRKYESHLKGQAQLLETLGALVGAKRSAIMCFEKNWKACHRSVLSRILEGRGYGSVHL